MNAGWVQSIVLKTIRKSLRLKVEREPDVDRQSFSVHLELNGVTIPESFVVISLDAGIHNDDLEFEVV